MAVRLDSPLLVFDAVSWAQSLIAKFEECKLAEPSARGKRDFERFISEIHAWLDRSITSRSVIGLALRQGMLPRIVGRSNLAAYIRKVLALSKLAEDSDEPQFLLYVDREPRLYVTAELRAQARHTGPEIQGFVVDLEELRNYISEAFRESQLANQIRSSATAL